MFAAVMIRFNLGRTFCDHAVEVEGREGRGGSGGGGGVAPPFTVVLHGQDARALQDMQMNPQRRQSLGQMDSPDVVFQ